MSTQFIVNTMGGKKIIIFLLTVWSQLIDNSRVFAAYPCYPMPSTPILKNPFLSGNHFNPVAQMSITFLPFIPLLRPRLRTLEHRMSRLQRLSQLQRREKEERVKRDKEMNHNLSSHLFRPHIHAGGTNTVAYKNMNLFVLSPQQSNQLKLFNH